MDFFEAQAHAKKRTHRLVFLFALAVLGTIVSSYAAAIIARDHLGRPSNFTPGPQRYFDREERFFVPGWWDPQIFAGVALGTLAIVGAAALYKWSQMRQGGSAVAEMVGGRRLEPHTTDRRERRLLNVVEEMAIAAGLPLPTVYVIDGEPGINAFAAGLTTSDAAVTVTRGTLDKLTRDELQGVIGHEFSHILNGDMRLNVKLTAIVFGILVIGLLGRGILQSLGRGRVGGGGKKGGGIAAIIAIGLALMIIGYVGYFFGRLIQAAVSRQREFLADASAVQFTRNPGGISGALKKIGGYAIGSSLENHEAAQFSHFFFAQAFRSNFGGLWATHPPLDERIRAVEAQWDGKFIDPPEIVDVEHQSFVSAGLAPKQAAPPGIFGPAAALAAIGSLTPQHVDYAQALLAKVPPRLRDASRSATEGPALVYALLLDADPAVREKQLALIGSLDSGPALRAARELLPAVTAAPAETRLPLVNLTLPVLRNLSDEAVGRFTRTTDALILADNTISAFEFMIQKALLRHVVRARQPDQHAKPSIFSLSSLASETGLVLSILASAAGDERRLQVAAFAAGVSQLPRISAQLAFAAADTWDFFELDAALTKLGTASDPLKQELLFAAAHVISQDGIIQPTEAELLRAVSDALGCPMPPLIATAEPAGHGS
jgi:Zn-dependent protease with chaperone function